MSCKNYCGPAACCSTPIEDHWLRGTLGATLKRIEWGTDLASQGPES